MRYSGLVAAVLVAGCTWMSGSAQQPATAQQPPPAQQSPPAQPPPPAQQSPSPSEKKAVIETPSMRLASARNVLIVRTRGSVVAFEVIQSTVDGWGRFTLVETREKADLIIEIASGGDSGVQVLSSSGVSPDTGREEKSTQSRKDMLPTEISMMVFDARNKRPLWSATESVKFAMKEKTKENNLVEAAERLASKFHQRLEPAVAK
jgi:hypothetical protein